LDQKLQRCIVGGNRPTIRSVQGRQRAVILRAAVPARFMYSPYVGNLKEGGPPDAVKDTSPRHGSDSADGRADAPHSWKSIPTVMTDIVVCPMNFPSGGDRSAAETAGALTQAPGLGMPPEGSLGMKLLGRERLDVPPG